MSIALRQIVAGNSVTNPSATALAAIGRGWQQMIYFPALLPDETARTFLRWPDEHLSRQRPAFQARFRGAIEGLALAVGASLTVLELRAPASDAHRLLGWASERPWLLADQ